MNKQWATKRTGFTIVELLIVIVVIAILAAISIVAYNGIQARAENTKTINGVAAYAKIFALYASEKGEYPSTSGYPCLDTTITTGCARVSGTTGCTYAGLAANNPAFFTLLAPYVTTQPSISSQTMNCNGNVYRGAYVARNDTNPKNLHMYFYLKGNVECPQSMGVAKLVSRAQADETTQCQVSMPSL